MKKSIIAAGAASVALAAMPIVGVFATETAQGNVSDEINATVTSGCSVSDAENTKKVNLSVAPGSSVESTAAGSISIVCTGVAWDVTVAGSSSETLADSNKLIQTKDGDGQPVASNPATISPMGTEGTVSTWGYKVTSATDSNIGVVDAKKNWHAVPDSGSAEIIASGAAGTPVSGTIYTQYKIDAISTQAAGTYEGQVTYTVNKVTQ